VYVDSLEDDDLSFIIATLHPEIDHATRTKMIRFNMLMHHETMIANSFGRKGAPWEFNLRDVFRWCEFMKRNQTSRAWNAASGVDLIYRQVCCVIATLYNIAAYAN